MLLDPGQHLISLCMTLDHCMQSKEKACNHFSTCIKIGAVATFAVVLRWMCDSPRMGCVRRTTNIYSWRKQAIIREIATHGLYCCMLPQCEALRTCCSGFSNRNSSKCDNVTVDTILPSRSTIKKETWWQVQIGES